MESLTTPGVYFESLQPVRISGQLLRSDITALIGYATRGPVFLPVRIESLRQYIAIFGDAPVYGYLAFAVKAFFENGGRTCYVQRIVDKNALAAEVELPAINGSLLWRTYAAFRISDINAVEAIDSSSPDQAVLSNTEPNTIREPIDNPGAWGNSIGISLRRKSRLSTRVNGVFNEGFSTFMDSLVGLEKYSVVELTQDQLDVDKNIVPVTKIVEIESIDKLRQSINWAESLLAGDKPFSANEPIRLDTVEFEIKISFDNRLKETFSWLGIHPLHSRSLHKVIKEESSFVNFQFTGEASDDWMNKELWPAETARLLLQGGTDGVSLIDSSHYLQALSISASVDDISIVAAPDLVLSSIELNAPVSDPIPRVIDCELLTAPSSGKVVGIVTDGIDALVNVAVTDAESGQRVMTDSEGMFTLENLNISLRTLRFEKAGFSSEERQVFSVISVPAITELFSLEPLAIPRSLTELEILDVQRAMANPYTLGRYRVALLDPPKANMKLDQIRSWRSKIGDSAFAALYYPWISTPPTTDINQSELTSLPPCGHIAGLAARLDLQQGAQRAPANINLRFAKGVSIKVNEIQHGILNPESINAIRSLPGQGVRILGARTLASDAEWRYLNVRRLVLALEKTLEASMQWAVFESNTTVLRQAVVMSIRALLDSLWSSGALAGKTADAAYRIKCDVDNNPDDARSNGQLLAEVGIAPSVPFEFIRIRLGKTLDAIEVTE